MRWSVRSVIGTDIVAAATPDISSTSAFHCGRIFGHLLLLTPFGKGQFDARKIADTGNTFQ
jgi:hypothetical protein